MLTYSWAEINIPDNVPTQTTLEREEEKKIETEIALDKNSLIDTAEVTVRVSKEIEMRYFSFLKFFLEKEKHIYYQPSRIKST